MQKIKTWTFFGTLCSAVSQVPGLISCDVIFGELNLFNHSAQM